MKTHTKQTNNVVRDDEPGASYILDCYRTDNLCLKEFEEVWNNLIGDPFDKIDRGIWMAD